MPAILPIGALIALFLVFRKFRLPDGRALVLLAALAWGLLLTAITELLSAVRWLEFWPVAGAWGIALALLVATLVVGKAGRDFLRPAPLLARLSAFDYVMLAYLLFVAVSTGVIAWVAAPNNWDSMTYHLSRVMHWMQNKSVAMYPTHILRQLHQNPWAEFAILQFQILSGDDRFANLVQWLSMLGSLVGVSLVAKELGASVRGQCFAAVICAAIPMGILQSTSTQTDYVVSFWLVCFVYFGMLLKGETGLVSALGAGASLGLAILTKATAYIFALPFLVWIGVAAVRARDARKARFIALALAIAFVTNLGHYARNFELYGNPLGPGKEGPALIYANETHSLASLSSNVLRNLTLHLGTPWQKVNSRVQTEIERAHAFIGISASDPRTTWGGTEFHIVPITLHEDNTGNPLHLILVFLSLVLLALRPPGKKDVVAYVSCLVFGFLLFCFYPKWQPWSSRLHLPLFVLWAPFIGLMFSLVQPRRLASWAILLVIVASLQWIFYNSTRPLVRGDSILATYRTNERDNIFSTSRTDRYFANQKALAEPYKEAARILSGLDCPNIGLDIGGDDWEYPLWVLLREQERKPFRLEHVNVDNVSAQLQDVRPGRHFDACAVFRIAPTPADTDVIGNATFAKLWSSGSIGIYSRVLGSAQGGAESSASLPEAIGASVAAMQANPH
jgi:4-amino-4-deoxy-L-arabinose transferase-like glycosyltransferase